MGEGEQNLLSAFEKSQLTAHSGLKGDGRAKALAEFLQKRLPAGYGVLTRGEIVDHADRRSGETDIIIFDKIRNAVLSEDPLWVPAEALLAYVEVKSTLTRGEIRRSYEAAKKISSLKPFKRSFSLAVAAQQNGLDDVLLRSTVDSDPEPLRCFRTIFAYESDLAAQTWLQNEWTRIVEVSSELNCTPALVDRIFVLNRGMINPPSANGTDEAVTTSIFQQWFINLMNFLSRENSRRPPVDWQAYTKRRLPGWRRL